MSLMGGLLKIPGSLVAAEFAPEREWEISDYLLAELTDRVGNLFNSEKHGRAYPPIPRPGQDPPSDDDGDDTVTGSPEEIERILARPRKPITE